MVGADEVLPTGAIPAFPATIPPARLPERYTPDVGANLAACRFRRTVAGYVERECQA